MEFYVLTPSWSLSHRSFQFPTGWNSTRTAKLMASRSLVSIPNGMEFYSIRPSLWLLLAEFQFPTGWNSTQFNLIYFTIIASFNSQRDGILRLQKTPNFTCKSQFQFPTGWNSTEIPAEDRCYITTFQFPTGWNSTVVKAVLLGIEALFQFPTGWNSTNRYRATYLYTYVSITNGMEFYFIIIGFFWIIQGFNSQRDGILQRC